MLLMLLEVHTDYIYWMRHCFTTIFTEIDRSSFFHFYFQKIKSSLKLNGRTLQTEMTVWFYDEVYIGHWQ